MLSDMNRKSVLVLLFTLLVGLQGCKVAVIVVEGGEVQSTMSGTCIPANPGVFGSVCIHEVSDTNFSETFTAVPDSGMTFVKWNSGDGFLCADSTNPACEVSNTVFAGNPFAEAIVSSNAVFYLMPIFSESVDLNPGVWGESIWGEATYQ